MNLLFRNFYILIILSLLQVPVLRSQDLSTPLDPAKKPLSSEYGFFVGFGSNFQSGNMFVNCEDCLFDNGVGIGFTIGALYEKEILKKLYAGAALSFDYMGITAAFREWEPRDFSVGNDIEIIPMLMRHEAQSNILFLSGMPYLRWNPFSFMYFRLGFSLSYAFNANVIHKQQLLQQSVIVSSGDTAYLDFEEYDEANITLEDDDIPELNKLQFSLNPAIGFNFMLTSKVTLSPVFQYNIPLTNISDRGEDFRVNSWRILAELRIFIPPPTRSKLKD